ncbi:hypothetical protein [Candidatus Electronema sp. JM]|uniref:hypothetical protein n=1 Tax=Candidatus Electronema sp. JM TaxID=3401571 RepID=UPI003AA909DF
MTNESSLERALEKAAKIICTLKLGCCPVQEKNFSGCPSECHENILPWQCWLVYLRGSVSPQQTSDILLQS